MKKEYIRRIFTNIEKLKEEGIYLSGIDGEGEYKMWYDNGQLYRHCFYKNGELDGEYKEWYKNNKLWEHCFFKKRRIEGEYKAWYNNGKLMLHFFYKNGNKIDMPKEIKDGYIYVNGKYYSDESDIQ